jgi:hypothetical protein
MRQSPPIYATLFGNSSAQLPAVFCKHYANKPYSQDVFRADGQLDITCHGPFKLMAPLLKWLGQVPPFTACNVPVTVLFCSEPHSNALIMDRLFHFEHGPYRFRSKIIPLENGNAIEVMRYRLCWKMRFIWDDNKVRLEAHSYGLYLFGHYIPLPLGWLLGKADADEQAIDDSHFSMQTSITHPLWGKVYGYAGILKMVDPT